MDRQTKNLTSPSGLEIVINTYLTGREYEYIQEPLYEAMQMKGTGSEEDVEITNLNKFRESNHRMIEKMVVSIAGNKDKVLDTVLDLPFTDYQFVIDALNEVTKKKLINTDVIAICREMGWDYYTYMSQPYFFVDAVKDFMVKEQRARMREMKRQQRQSKMRSRGGR